MSSRRRRISTPNIEMLDGVPPGGTPTRRLRPYHCFMLGMRDKKTAAPPADDLNSGPMAADAGASSHRWLT